MNFTDWLVNIALVALVVRQIRWNRMDRRFVVLPLALVGSGRRQLPAHHPHRRKRPRTRRRPDVRSASPSAASAPSPPASVPTEASTPSPLAPARGRCCGSPASAAGSAFVLYTEHGGAASVAQLQRQPQHHDRRRLDRRARPHGARRGRHPRRHPRPAQLPRSGAGPRNERRHGRDVRSGCRSRWVSED